MPKSMHDCQLCQSVYIAHNITKGTHAVAWRSVLESSCTHMHVILITAALSGRRDDCAMVTSILDRGFTGTASKHTA